MKQQRQRQAPLPQWAIPIGTQVIIRGLENAQEHNDKSGRIVGFNQEKGRYQVECGQDTTISLRPSNLTQQVTVFLHGLESKPDLNGQKGRITNYKDNRYQVRLEVQTAGHSVVGLQASNVMLPVNTRVVLQGLSKEEFNGQMAQITEIVEEDQRYVVACQSGKTIKIKW